VGGIQGSGQPVGESAASAMQPDLRGDRVQPGTGFVARRRATRKGLETTSLAASVPTGLVA